MTYLRLSEEAVEALADGRGVTLKSSYLGPDGRNGAVTLVPPGCDTEADEPFEIRLEGSR